MSCNEESCPCGHWDTSHFDGRCIEDGCGCERQIVSSFIEDCEAAKSAEEVEEIIGRYYEMPDNSAGGSLHVVLDDGNIRRRDVMDCEKWAAERGDLAGLALARLLLRLDKKTFMKVLADDGEVAVKVAADVSVRMSMNLTGLGLDDVTRLYRLAERDIEKLQRDIRAAEASAARMEAMLEQVAPECPDCQLIRRDFGGDPRAPIGLHQSECPETNGRPELVWRESL